jgi:hypothetical protein
MLLPLDNGTPNIKWPSKQNSYVNKIFFYVTIA